MMQMLIITCITSTELSKSKVNIIGVLSFYSQADLEQRERIWVQNVIFYQVKSVFGAFVLFV